MKAGLLLTGSGTLVYLTSHAQVLDPDLIERFETKGISKFIVYEVPLDTAKQRYGHHFEVVMDDLHETDDLRILDIEGSRAFRMFSFEELGEPKFYEAAR